MLPSMAILAMGVTSFLLFLPTYLSTCILTCLLPACSGEQAGQELGACPLEAVLRGAADQQARCSEY